MKRIYPVIITMSPVATKTPRNVSYFILTIFWVEYQLKSFQLCSEMQFFTLQKSFLIALRGKQQNVPTLQQHCKNLFFSIFFCNFSKSSHSYVGPLS